MKVSLKWLRDYVDVTLTAEELARRLTMAGIEVEGIQHTGGEWDNVWVARIEKIEPHPNADRLTLVTADYGKRRTIRVVTGASNIREGDIVPLGLVGTRYRDGHTSPTQMSVLKRTNVRGVTSEGMVMSGFELGLNDDHAGIMILPPDTPVGIPLAEALGDSVIELDLKGRPDCLAMIGVAREVGALNEQPVRVPMVDPKPSRPRRDDEPLAIEIEDPDLCRRYTGVLLKNVKIGPSPAWMQERLQAAGMRPINNVVDITNFVMLEWSQPLHAFDYETIRGGKIIVRTGRPGEVLRTLAEERPDISLTPEQLVIADAERPVALAGVIGGADTEVRETTTSILLESANFKPASIRRTARALLPRPTEASRRFERGIPPEHTMPAALRAAQLMADLASAEIVGEPVDVYPNPDQRPVIRIAPGEFERLLGVAYAPATIENILDRLGFMYEKPDPVATQGDYIVHAPVWRIDIERSADLVEEVARIDGYDRIPTSVMRGEPPVPAQNWPLFWEATARDVLAAAGFAEVITYTLTSEDREARWPLAAGERADGTIAALTDDRIAPHGEPVRLANPDSADETILRRSALPSLLECLRGNLRHADRDVHLFELSRIYVLRDHNLPEERRVITAVTGQYRSGPTWGSPLENDFYYVKDVLEAVLERLGIEGHGYIPIQHPAFHPHRTAAVVLNHRPEAAGKKPVLPEDVLGVVGEIDPEARRAFDVDQRCYVVAVDFDRLIAHATTERQYHPLPRFESVVEDLAFVVPDELPAERLVASIKRAGAPLVETVQLFDVYKGERVPEGTKSLAYTVTYRADHTLTNEEVAALRQKIVQAAERQTGAKLRT
ncbi:MAG: phenylalanine--tRNA ligase subunit beta [Chloroflexi bacterium]|nr:phenylalanine--tRNA ligase subunit beta [Chloroflexota bacterium]